MSNLPLDAFGGKLFFTTAWEFNRADVETFIDQVVNDLTSHGVPDSWKTAAGLIRGYITQLKPGQGNESASYYPIPPQYLYRKELVNAAPPPEERPDPPVADEPVSFELDPKAVSNHRVYGMYDFLGYFLSLAPAPDGADRDNFFAPWLVIYWKWCKLFQATEQEKKDSQLNWDKPIKDPKMLQCTWRKTNIEGEDNEDIEKIVFHMGASLGGYAFVGPKGEYGVYQTKKNNWTQSILRFRFNLLADPGSGKVNNQYEWTKAPEYELTAAQAKKSGEKVKKTLMNLAKSGWDFGNCAETYPFLEILSDGGHTSRTEYGGLSIKPEAMAAALEGEPEAFKTPIITPPCRNCQYLLESKYGCGAGNFQPPVSNPTA
ncbi:hypothetical protein BDV26DRAFT_289822 [Aspergillus bertholletiae]|uniref:Uncharacterized protein n=1 Tax=Aspergillus bertholletiae TaxID=1226010 RepID=A0A5N7BH79_9EURO|nr:hypothetical protein BDV26DRAFT_289822 [Aspergillus bertholletiae]